jgi:hypothetical protein
MKLSTPLRVAVLALCLAGDGAPGARFVRAGEVVAHAAQEREPDLKTVLRRSGDYVRDYRDRLSEIVAEERYVQRTEADRPDRDVQKRERVLKSDFMLLRGYAGEDSWIGVREVFEIDGESAEGERGHLWSLLMDTQTPVSIRLRALADQQARYNLGSLYRTINVPTVALEFLRPDRQSRTRYKRSGTAVFHDRQVWTVTFEDRDRPTLIRTPTGQDVRSTGVFWIDPRDGAVLRTELHAGENRGHGFRSMILVSYQRIDRFDMLLPDDMNELYVTGATRIEGHATYGNFRRFETDARIKY